MACKLDIEFDAKPALTIHRAAFGHKKLVYIARADKKLTYKRNKSRIGYIGTTKKGAKRFAATLVSRGKRLLKMFGNINRVEVHVVACERLQNVQTWRKLERALLIRFRERLGDIPLANKAGRKMQWDDEKKYFTKAMLDKVIDTLA